MKNKFRLAASGAAVASALLLTPWLAGKNNEPARPLDKMKIDTSDVEREGGFAKSYANIVDKVAPSVVSIYITKHVRLPASYRNYGLTAPDQTGLGSGVIISADGYILTNNHVVGDADKIRVALNEGTKEYDAEIIGRDPSTDVAVIKIDAKELPAITVADSEKVRVGDVVLAVGNPFGLRQTVSMGIVSAKGRTEVGITEYGNFLQTDASINPGNSGGALVDANGRLIGINTAIFSQTGASVGIGFAIPVNQAVGVVEDLMTDGHVTRGFLGVGLEPMTQEIAKALDRDSLDGVLVREVGRNTPADVAGVKQYDLIVECDGEAITDVRRLQIKIADKNPGDEILFKVIRDGRPVELKAVLASKENMFSTGKPSASPVNVNGIELVEGVYVAEVPGRDRRLHIQVTGVDEDAPGKNARLMRGDTVLEIDRQPVASIDDVKNIKENSSSDRILVRVLSTDGETKLFVLES